MADPSVSFVPVFQNVIVPLFQEDPDGIQGAVRYRAITGKTDHWERLGGTALTQVTGRHQATPYTPATHSRRRLTLNDFAGGERLDDLDAVKMMIDPRSAARSNIFTRANWSRCSSSAQREIARGAS